MRGNDQAHDGYATRYAQPRLKRRTSQEKACINESNNCYSEMTVYYSTYLKKELMTGGTLMLSESRKWQLIDEQSQ